MEFIETTETTGFKAITKNGNTIEYNHIDVKDFVFASRLEPENIEEENTWSRIILKCSFDIKGGMLDLLESSRLLTELEMSNKDGDHLISFCVYPLFSYEKLQALIFDLAEKFNV